MFRKDELKEQSKFFLESAKEQGWLTPEIEKEEKAILASLLDKDKERNIHNASNPPEKGKVILICTCEHCEHVKARIDGETEEECPCSYCN